MPELPHVIVCPNALLDQWTGELHRFLQYGAFSILPYVGACTENNRAAFWHAFNSLKSRPDRRIILASYNVSVTERMHYW